MIVGVGFWFQKHAVEFIFCVLVRFTVVLNNLISYLLNQFTFFAMSPSMVLVMDREGKLGI